MGSNNLKSFSDPQPRPSIPKSAAMLRKIDGALQRAEANQSLDKSADLVASDSMTAHRQEDEIELLEASGGTGELITFQVMSTGGYEIEAAVSSDASVLDLRGVVAAQLQHLPAGANLRLLQGPQVLSDRQSVSALDPNELLFAVVCRDTPLEQLLLEAGSYEGYADILSEAFKNNDATSVTTGPMPSILDVLEDMGGQPPKMDGVTMSADGAMQFASENGALILPSLDLKPHLKAAGIIEAKSVTLCVGVNSDAYNRGLGVVVNANPSLDVSTSEDGLPSYAYNGYGLKEGIRGNAIKFHPGMGGGQFRIEGKGGHGNRSMNFTPQNWTASKSKLHLFEITLNKDGSNHIRVTGTDARQIYTETWTHQLFDGRYAPSMYAWLDLGSSCSRTPLHVGAISMRVNLNK